MQENNGWEQGKRYLAEGKAREAREVFADLLQSRPGEPDIYLFLAFASLRLRDVQAAESHIRRALALAPDHAEARTLLGWINLEVRKDYSAAIEEYAKVVRLKPGLPESHNNLGVAYRKRGDSEMALASFDRALALQRNYSEAWSNRGWVSVERKNWQAARSDFERALQINSRDEGALYGMAQVLRATRDYAGAQQALKRAMGQSPNFVYWLEWGQLTLVRYYWVLLLVAGGFFLQVQYQKANARRKANGG